jgi:pimeloyl-ACP methyl ester carboxylesterase
LARESTIDELALFRTTIAGKQVRFVHERGRGTHPLPLLLTHGFPDSFLRFEKVIPMLADPASHGGDPGDTSMRPR